MTSALMLCTLCSMLYVLGKYRGINYKRAPQGLAPASAVRQGKVTVPGSTRRAIHVAIPISQAYVVIWLKPYFHVIRNFALGLMNPCCGAVG